MQSFDTKDSNILESFDRKFESYDTFGTKDSEMEQSDNYCVKSFDTKGSEVKQSHNEFVEGSDRKFETEEKALPDSESFGTKDSNVSIPNFNNFNANSDDDNNQSSTQLNCACPGSE